VRECGEATEVALKGSAKAGTEEETPRAILKKDEMHFN
jgi:hypothetical protein